MGTECIDESVRRNKWGWKARQCVGVSVPLLIPILNHQFKYIYWLMLSLDQLPIPTISYQCVCSPLRLYALRWHTQSISYSQIWELTHHINVSDDSQSEALGELFNVTTVLSNSYMTRYKQPRQGDLCYSLAYGPAYHTYFTFASGIVELRPCVLWG